jgi:integrase
MLSGAAAAHHPATPRPLYPNEPEPTSGRVAPGYQWSEGPWRDNNPAYTPDTAMDSTEPARSTNEIFRMYWRNQGGRLRAYADLRYLGGRREALIPPGETRATSDAEIARELLHRRIKALKEQTRQDIWHSIDPGPDLADFAIHHLERMGSSREGGSGWLFNTEKNLTRVVKYFTCYQHASTRDPKPQPRPRSLSTIDVQDVHAFHEWLKTQPNGRGGLLSAQSRRHHLSALSGLFKRAIDEGKLPMGSNPVAAMTYKPSEPNRETAWLEAGDLALLLESARTFALEARAAGCQTSLPCIYELLATFVLTGAKEGEIRRLQVDHLDFSSHIIRIPDAKTGQVDRSILMHAQLREILLPYVRQLGRSTGLVFTTPSGDAVGDWRRTLDLVATGAGFRMGQIRTQVLRTSYITHRLACMDHGVPIDPHQVAREVGYTSQTMIMKVCERAHQHRRGSMNELAFRPEAIGTDSSAPLQAHAPGISSPFAEKLTR